MFDVVLPISCEIIYKSIVQFLVSWNQENKVVYSKIKGYINQYIFCILILSQSFYFIFVRLALNLFF